MHQINDQLPESASTSASPQPLTLEHLAHELNSLLDGSMRCVRLAQTSLAEPESLDSSLNRDSIERRLEVALRAMSQMAGLLEQVMTCNRPDLTVFVEPITIAVAVEQIMEVVETLAEEHHVSFRVTIDQEASRLPVGPLGHVIDNGLCNAIAACRHVENGQRMIDLAISMSSHDDLLILMTDSGCGLVDCRSNGVGENGTHKDGGHGIGLALCRQIVFELGGRMRLVNVPYGHGAVLEVCVPVRSLYK